VKINELETRLSVTRANVRFYEKEGLLQPSRSGNGYRDYSEQDVETLQKIIIFRKLGLSIEDIRAILNKELALADAVHSNLKQLQKQMNDLQGAMDVCKKMEQEQADAASFDIQRYWDMIHSQEEKGQRFFDYVKDYAKYEKELFSNMWIVNFLWDFRGTEKKYGFRIALLIALGCCVLRGFFTQFLWHSGSFLYGFTYPFVIFALISAILFPTYALNKKYENTPEVDKMKVKKQPFYLRFLKGFGKLLSILFALFMAIFGVPILEEAFIYTPWLEKIGVGEKATFCLQNNLYMLYTVVSFTVIFSVMSLHSSKGLGYLLVDPETGEPRQNRIPKNVRWRMTAFFLGVYCLVLVLYSGWFDLYTADGLTVQRLIFHKEYTWEQAESFHMQRSSDGTLSYVITMQNGKKFDLMSAGSSSGDMEEMGLLLTRKFKDIGVPCLVRDWDELREKLHHYNYWQGYLDELRGIVGNI